MVNQFSDRDPAFLRGRTLLQYYGVKGQSAWGNIGVVCGFAGFYFFVCWLVLSFKRYDKR